jgi:hypothetical protein
MLKLVNAEGKPISAEGVDPKTASFIEAVVGGIGHQMTAAMSATVNNALKPVTDKITGFETAMTEIKAAGTGGKGDGNTGGKPDPKADEIPAWAKSLVETVTEVKSTLTGRQQAEQVNSLANAWLDKNRPGLKPDQRKAVLAAILAGKPDSEEKVAEIFKAKQDEYAAIFGKENAEKAFTASVEGEGGEKAKAKNDEAAAEKAAIENLSRMSETARK